MKFVRRADVKSRLLAKWADAIVVAKKRGLPFTIPDWDRLRNYELESFMQANFGNDGWVVCEWCPFDGIFCIYRHGASRHDLKSVREEFMAWRPREGMPDLNRPYLFGLLDEQLARRPDDLGEKQMWGQGIVDYLEELDSKVAV
jgi:hypothetical protein